MTATTAVPRAELQDPRAQADAEMPDAGKLLAEQRRIRDNRAVQRVWLAIVLVAILALVLVGGATRLTDSGLSITEWKPIHGVIPPLRRGGMAGRTRTLPPDPRIPADQQGHEP
jgi:hypothetical protein